VGAHLPLDVVGGVALGVAVGTWAADRAGTGIGTGGGDRGGTGITDHHGVTGDRGGTGVTGRG
jgi:hypothetical protein